MLLDSKELKKRDEWTAQRLAWIGRHYTFTDDEREVFNEYYNIVAPFRWPYHSLFLSILDNREKYPDGREYAGLILDWTEYQMTRKDGSSLLFVTKYLTRNIGKIYCLKIYHTESFNQFRKSSKTSLRNGIYILCRR